MLRQIIDSTATPALAETAKAECRKGMRRAIKQLAVLTASLIIGYTLQVMQPSLLGAIGDKMLAGVTVLIISKAMDWLILKQRLSKLTRSPNFSEVPDRGSYQLRKGLQISGLKSKVRRSWPG